MTLQCYAYREMTITTKKQNIRLIENQLQYISTSDVETFILALELQSSAALKSML